MISLAKEFVHYKKNGGDYVAESFFGSLKQERVRWNNYATRYEAQQDILHY
jgi:hypothetical protein